GLRNRRPPLDGILAIVRLKHLGTGHYVPLVLLEGRHALITGAGPGLGRALALLFAKEGADVTLVARTPGTLDETAAAVEAAGRRALTVPADVSSIADTRAMASAAFEAFGRIDVLV